MRAAASRRPPLRGMPQMHERGCHTDRRAVERPESHSPALVFLAPTLKPLVERTVLVDAAAEDDAAASLNSEVRTLRQLRHVSGSRRHQPVRSQFRQPEDCAVRHRPRRARRDVRDGVRESGAPHVGVSNHKRVGIRLRDRSIRRRRLAPWSLAVLADDHRPPIKRVTRLDVVKRARSVLAADVAPRNQDADRHATGAGSNVSVASSSGAGDQNHARNTSPTAAGPPASRRRP